MSTKTVLKSQTGFTLIEIIAGVIPFSGEVFFEEAKRINSFVL
jgi:hypothetical protein